MGPEVLCVLVFVDFTNAVNFAFGKFSNYIFLIEIFAKITDLIKLDLTKTRMYPSRMRTARFTTSIPCWDRYHHPL